MLAQRTWILVILAMGCLVVLSDPAARLIAQEPPAKIISQDFRNQRPLPEEFALVGPDTDGEIKAEDEGLRITLGATRQHHIPAEVTARFTLSGDFEITGTYELLSGERPQKGYGVGVHLNIADTDARIKFAKVCRAKMPTEGSVHLTQYWHDKKDFQQRHHPTERNAGQLRLVRSGASLRYLVSDGPGQLFREMWFQENFGTEDIEHLRFGVSDSGEPGNPVDARLIALTIRQGKTALHQAFEPAPLAAPASVENVADDGTARSWWLLGAAMMAILGIAVGLWVYHRRRRRPTLEQT